MGWDGYKGGSKAAGIFSFLTQDGLSDSFESLAGCKEIGGKVDYPAKQVCLFFSFYRRDPIHLRSHNNAGRMAFIGGISILQIRSK